MRNFVKIVCLSTVIVFGACSVQASEDGFVPSPKEKPAINEKVLKALLARIKNVTHGDWLTTETSAAAAGVIGTMASAPLLWAYMLLIKWAANCSVHYLSSKYEGFDKTFGDEIVAPLHFVAWLGVSFCVWILWRNALKRKWKSNERKEILEILEKLGELGFDVEQFGVEL